MTKYYLKDHVTDDMLLAVGFRLVFDKYIKAIKTLEHRSVFIDNGGEVMTWFKNDIQDLIELDYVEARE
ncbi:MAG: hypothetical protein RBQ97_09950 [Acholeplasma sp.]|nr:hypothetical protein [Acholeplasma sp.]